MRYRPTLRHNPRGAILAQVALSMTALAATLAVVLDGGLLLAEHQRAQATADAAALAAAADLFAKYATASGIDSSGTANTSAITTATANGYTSSNSTIDVRLNPANYKGGPNAGTQVPAGYAEVTVTYNQPRYFSALWGTTTIPVSARAVARGKWIAASPGILLLEPTGPGALTVTGNGSVRVANAPIVVNDNSSSAITTSGNNAVVTDSNSSILVGGSPGYSGSGISPTPIPNQTPTPDPLRFLPELSQPSAAPASTTSNGVTTYYPGYYPNGLSLTGGYTAVFQSGNYYMGGTFKVNGNGSSSLTGSGVMIFIGPNGSLDMGGNGSVTLSPPTSGTYQGMTIFQSRSNNSDVKIAGNGNYNTTGTFYAPDAQLKVTGNGDVALASQLIGYTMSNTGGGNSGQVNIVYSNGNVAKTRIFNLVE
jgi:Flp pilus assembly protein TadG